jgi:hypothetical protein
MMREGVVGSSGSSGQGDSGGFVYLFDCGIEHMLDSVNVVIRMDLCISLIPISGNLIQVYSKYEVWILEL